jgi:hypothetical protein
MIYKETPDPMDMITKAEMRRLAEISGDPCVSIYMPTQQKTVDYKKDLIRYKNLLATAQKSLSDYHGKADPVTAMIAPAHRLMDDMAFWRHQSHGLAVFLALDDYFVYRFPLRFEELVVCAGRFHLKPLLPLFSNNGRFFILALSQNEIRLFECTRYDVVERMLKMPGRGLDETLDYDTKRRQLQYHTGAANGAGSRPAMFHGHGVGKDDEKDEILRYFRTVDEKLNRMLPDEQSPLVPAGVDHILPLFRSASTYPYITDNGITGNPEALSGKALHEMAWDIVAPLFREGQRAALERHRELAGTGLASADFDTVVKAACYGRVDTLFVKRGVQRWGLFDRDTQQISVYEEPALGVEDLLDLAAVETFKHNGAVYALDAAEMPEKGTLAALMRY